jgi:hypothetical protein
MKSLFCNSRRLLFALAILTAYFSKALGGEAEFPYTVRFELGDQEFAPGDNITIQQVHGTKETLATGETYVVEGTYTLNSREAAEISLFVTTSSATPTPIDPKQTLRIAKGTGTFRLVKTMADSGYPHVTFYPVPSGNGFGGVYFGEGTWVLRDKHFKYLTNSSRSTASSAGAESRLPTGPGPNQVLFEYLGEAVEPPANLNPAYTRAGLLEAMRTATEKAGVSLKKIEIDDSEFPFLIGVICDDNDFETKLKEQFKKMDGYEYTGSVSSHSHRAFNIVPWREFPAQSSERIGRRLMLRQRVLFDRISGVL